MAVIKILHILTGGPLNFESLGFSLLSLYVNLALPKLWKGYVDHVTITCMESRIDKQSLNSKFVCYIQFCINPFERKTRTQCKRREFLNFKQWRRRQWETTLSLWIKPGSSQIIKTNLCRLIIIYTLKGYNI